MFDIRLTNPKNDESPGRPGLLLYAYLQDLYE